MNSFGNFLNEQKVIIDNAKKYISEIFKEDSSDHDYEHSLRVYKNAMDIELPPSTEGLMKMALTYRNMSNYVPLFFETLKTKSELLLLLFSGQGLRQASWRVPFLPWAFVALLLRADGWSCAVSLSHGP